MASKAQYRATSVANCCCFLWVLVLLLIVFFVYRYTDMLKELRVRVLREANAGTEDGWLFEGTKQGVEVWKKQVSIRILVSTSRFKSHDVIRL